MSQSEILKREVIKSIKEGDKADRLAVNPYRRSYDIHKKQAWSAGHFDKWGRV